MAGKRKQGVDINNASADELRDMCGIEASTAEAIVNARADEGFDSIDEVASLPGVGARTVEKMKQNGCYCSGE